MGFELWRWSFADLGVSERHALSSIRSTSHWFTDSTDIMIKASKRDAGK
jgi:hypothetical protein